MILVPIEMPRVCVLCPLIDAHTVFEIGSFHGITQDPRFEHLRRDWLLEDMRVCCPCDRKIVITECFDTRHELCPLREVRE